MRSLDVRSINNCPINTLIKIISVMTVNKYTLLSNTVAHNATTTVTKNDGFDRYQSIVPGIVMNGSITNAKGGKKLIITILNISKTIEIIVAFISTLKDKIFTSQSILNIFLYFTDFYTLKQCR